ncbi:A/G-specific adenine glycosylase [Vannielia litorea]|uniref:A/G-specific adenine glycosylase n=1 Tax=Vannielia litorea TaxID=1217970 RepID=UPI001C93A4CE|nr:A/G-specific adenine glycosylase [Vannielia litorea]MBY6155066.1 A/G-specific adenine glycosylase [Vannielia litorea]
MSGALLEWYDAHARVLPWRVPPGSGERADPYRVWLSEVMLQQTTVAAVKDYFYTFTRLWPTVEALAATKDEDVMARWAGLGYYARARNLLKCARVVAERGGFPDTVEGLRDLPGIGPYTAAAVAAIAFGRSETVVDGNVERVMARLHAVQEPLPASKPVLVSHAAALTPEARAGDYAQAVMDLGATICTPKNPACGICPWRAPCAARAEGIAAELPRKTPKKPKPVRLGHVYVIRRGDGAFLLERRPEKGLLGGMLGWPGSGWAEEPPEGASPVSAALEEIGEVRHTFTHFHLILRVHAGTAEAEAPEGLHWERLSPAALPTVMRKAYDLAATSQALNVTGD